MASRLRVQRFVMPPCLERVMGLRIRFDGPPGPEAGRFIEVENEIGQSIKVGEWSEDDDGTWVLEIDEIPSFAKRHTHVAGADDIDKCRECGRNFRDGIHLRVGESA
jgi:hypothetical protein